MSGDEIRRGKNTDEHNQRDGKRKYAEHGIRNMCRFLFIVLRQQLCVNRNERCRQRAFAENVLQEIWDAEGGAECVAGRGGAEVVSEDPSVARGPRSG